MLQVQLYIEGQEVELYKDESITLTQSIQDVRDIQKIFTEYSRTFSVPASKNNNKIFKHFYNYYIDGFDARKKKSAEILINYKPFKKGKIKLEGVSLKNNEAHTYRLTFFGETVTLPDLLGEDRLANLGQLSVFNFRYNDTNIKAYMKDGLDATLGTEVIEDGIIFPLITHTNRLIYDSSKDEINNLYVAGSNNGVPFSQLKPALRVHAIIKAIELEYPQLKFSTDFFNENNEAYYNLYIWLHTKAGGIFVDQERQQLFKDLQVNNTKVKDLIVRNTNFEITNDRPNLNYELDYTVEPANNSTEYNLVITQNGTEFKRFNSLTGDTKNGEAINSGTVADPIEVNNGKFAAYIETTDATTFNLTVHIGRRNKETTVTSSLTTFADTSINILTQIPDMNILDFLTGLFKMFNLTAYVGTNGTIVVKTLDSFYASSSKVHDLTPYIDVTESQVDSPIPYRQVNLGYEGLDTFLAKNFQSSTNKGWGTLEYNSEFKLEGEVYEIELPFEHLLYEKLVDPNTSQEQNIQWGWFVDEQQEPTSGLPLLFYAIQADTGSIGVQNLAGTFDTVNTPYMPANSSGIWSSYIKDNMKQSINFHSEIDEYALRSNEKTLFDTYYKSYIKDLFEPKKRITKLSAYIPISIMHNLSLADDIVIFDKQYRINTITTNFETNQSELELTNILDDTITILPPVEIAELDIDASSGDITADSPITSDNGGIQGGFTEAADEEIPLEIPTNTPQQTTLEACEVTAASISAATHISEATAINFRYNITQAGLLCGQENIEEYGFLIATSSSTLTASDDIDTLKADSSITVRSVTGTNLTAGRKVGGVSGLTDPATRYARFYVRTNTDPQFDEADTISAVFSASTDAAIGATADSNKVTVDDTNSYTVDFTGDLDGDGTVEATVENRFVVLHAGIGSTGYATIPTIGEIENGDGVVQRNGGCGSVQEHGIYHHNGANALPIVGDRIKAINKNSYEGGNESFNTDVYYSPLFSYPSFGGYYGAFSMAYPDETLRTNTSTQESLKRYGVTVSKYAVFDIRTAEVVAVLDCDVPEVLLNKTYIITSPAYQYYYSNLLDTFAPNFCGRTTSETNLVEIEHNGSQMNPEIGDYVKAAGSQYNYSGGSSSFPSSFLTGRFMMMPLVNQASDGVQTFILVDLNTCQYYKNIDVHDR